MKDSKINDIKEIDIRTEWGKGMFFKTCDGKEVATMEEVRTYNEWYYKNMKTKTDKEEVVGRHR